jgi:hypothetical protein
MRTCSFARLTTVGVRSSSASLSTEYNEQAIMTAANRGDVVMPRATGYVARRSNSIHRRPRSSCPGQRGTRPGSIHKSMRGILSGAYSNTPRFVPAPSSHADMRTRSFARLTTVGVRSSTASLSTEYNEQAIMTAPNQGRRRHAPRSGVRRPLLHFRVNERNIERGI